MSPTTEGMVATAGTEGTADTVATVGTADTVDTTTTVGMEDTVTTTVVVPPLPLLVNLLPLPPLRRKVLAFSHSSPMLQFQLSFMHSFFSVSVFSPASRQ